MTDSFGSDSFFETDAKSKQERVLRIGRQRATQLISRRAVCSSFSTTGRCRAPARGAAFCSQSGGLFPLNGGDPQWDTLPIRDQSACMLPRTRERGLGALSTFVSIGAPGLISTALLSNLA